MAQNMPDYCAHDEDGNGLDDDMENQLAKCFVPESRFDAAENELRPCEPVTGFTAWRLTDVEPGHVLVKMHYEGLWRKNGGFAADDDFGCGDAHEGDNEYFDVTLDIHQDGGVWRAEPTAYNRCPNGQFDGTHLIFYHSAGKHHVYCTAGLGKYDITDPAGLCNDPHYGNGRIRVPAWLWHAPAIGPLTRWQCGVSAGAHPKTQNLSATLWASTVPQVAGTGGFVNACAWARDGSLTPAATLQPRDLTNLGFPGQDLLGLHFYSTETSGVPSFMHVGQDYTTDADADGFPEVSGIDFTKPREFGAKCVFDDHGNPIVLPDGSPQTAPVEEVVTPVSATDPCPIDPSQDDADGDGLSGICDPDSTWKNQYVGRGTADLPAVPTQPSWSSRPLYAYGGYWDSDQDTRPNGIDECPSIAKSALGLSNRVGEDANWPPDPVTNNQLGAFQRGDVCDPYPVSFSRWMPDDVKPASCKTFGTYASGDDSIPIQTQTYRGRSANDPAWDGTTINYPGYGWTAQTYRCACRDSNGDPLPGSGCVADPSSECFQAAVTPAADKTHPGRGWRPVERGGCALSPSSSWCASRNVAVPQLDTASDTISWDWTAELASHGPAKPEPHFESDDVQHVAGGLLNSAYDRLTHDYAAWTLIHIDQAPSFPQRPGSFYADPERVLAGSKLNDVTSLESRRMRSDLSDQTVKPEQLHSSVSIGVGCTLLTADQLLGRLTLWFGPDPVSFAGQNIADARVLAHAGGLVESAVLLRPAQQDYATILLASEPRTSGSWLATAQVSVVPMTATFRRIGGIEGSTVPIAIGASAEPDLLVLDRAGSNWARLAPVDSDATSVQYAVLEQGTIPASLSPDTVLVADSAGRAAAAVDFAAGAVESYSPDEQAWTRLFLPDALRGRQGAAVALWGPNLIIASGIRDGEPTTDFWVMDLYGAGAHELRGDLPPRVNAALTVTPDGGRVLLSGGRDPAGVLHDDVWALADPAHQPGQLLRQLSADTSGATQGTHSVLLPDRRGTALLRFVVNPDLDTKTRIETRTPSGWEPAGAGGKPKTCAADDVQGGRLCRLSDAWWADAGRVPCGGATCDGSAGVPSRLARIPGHRKAVAADADATGLWVLRKRSLERWIIAQDGSLHFVAAARLPARGWDVRARAGVALVATSRGVVRAQATEGALDLDPALPLCGRPVHVTPMADGVWGVQTTFAFVIVGGEPDAPLSPLSTSVLVPAGHGHGRAFSIGSDARTVAACRAFDREPGEIEELSRSSAVTSAGASRALVAWGDTLFDLDVSRPEAPEVRSALRLAEPLSALRADETGGRIYGLSRDGSLAPGHCNRDDAPIFDLRGVVLERSGQHDVPTWVLRRENGDVRVRVSRFGVDVAEVVP